MKAIRLVAAALFVFSNVVAAQRTAEPTGSNIHKIATIDSVDLRVFALEPNGRWVVLAYNDAIWVMPADGHAKPVRLLSPGHVDRWPVWFPSGDRLAFVSNRATRDGSQRMYGMTIAIDPNTGMAVGAPRQI